MISRVSERAVPLVLLVAAIGALMLGLCQTAGASGPASRRTPPSIDQTIGEQGSDGFFLALKVHDRDRLELSATKLGGNLSIEGANYKVPYHARPGSNEIKARFGKLGRVDMRFVPEKVKHVDPSGSNCKGGDIIEEEGFWIGLLAFHGEEGFTRVHVHSALGTVVRVPSLRCRPEKPPNLKKLKRLLEAIAKKAGEAKEDEEGAEEESGPEPPPFVLVATTRHNRVRFIASRESFSEGKRSSSESNLIVAGSRRRGRIEETGAVVDILAPGSYVRPTDSLEPTVETVIRPPGPFSGSAVYRDPPHRPATWTGDLKVELPGFGTVGLAGRRTHVVACESPFEPGCKDGLDSRPSSLLERLLRR